eukprot:TRINITY_DN13159_c2_g1_i2.p1 TRINITY_DN13159_c2_g1~~TRINITY_DN13159_c2_g1_i2.p1  ORF type:complete len:1325 (+),score=320.11 TRINITY_DN13159_c2_g1_i2:80-4054(+)
MAERPRSGLSSQSRSPEERGKPARARGASTKSTKSTAASLTTMASLVQPPTAAELAAASAQYVDVTMSETAPVGKQELLAWVADVSETKCGRFEHLKDGATFLRLFAKIFPVVDLSKFHWHQNPSTADEIAANWDAIQKLMAFLGMPAEALDVPRITKAKFKSMFQFTVMLFFLHHLSQCQGFMVDFSHPIDSPLAEFLQSTASVEVLRRGGAITDPDESVPDAPPEAAAADHTSATLPQPAAESVPAPTLLAPAAQLPLPGADDEWPAPGTEMETFGMSEMHELNGQRGLVVGVQRSGDAAGVIVDFPQVGRMLVQRGNLKAVSPPLPPAGAEVVTIGVPELADVRGRVLGQMLDEDGLRALVEFPPPHGQSLVHPRNLQIVAMPPPPVGSVVEFTDGHVEPGEQRPRGRVKDVTFTADGPVCLVSFPSPVGQHYLRPEQVRVLEWPMPPPGCKVIVVDAPELPQLCGAVGSVLGQKQAPDGMRCLVVFPPPHGQLLLRPANVRVCATSDGAEAAMGRNVGTSESASQSAGSYAMFGLTDEGGGPATQQTMQRLTARQQKAQERLLALENEVRQQRERNAALAALVTERGLRPDAATPAMLASDCTAPLWLDDDQKVRGQALVARLESEIECARLQQGYADGEAAALRQLVALTENQLRAAAQQDRLADQIRHRSDLLDREARRLSSAVQLRCGLRDDLLRMRRQALREAAAMQEPSESEESVREQLVRLRQQAVISGALQSASAIAKQELSELVHVLEQRDAVDAERADSLQSTCHSVLYSLATSDEPVGADEAVSTPLSAKRRSPLAAQTQRHGCAACGHALEQWAKDTGSKYAPNPLGPGSTAALSCDALTLCTRIRVLHCEAEATRHRNARLGEEQAAKASRAVGVPGQAGDKDGGREAEISSLRDAIGRLSELTDFLREASAQTESTADGTFAAEESVTNEEVAARLQAGDVAGLTDCFWSLVREQMHLRQVCATQTEELGQAQRQSDAVERELREQRAESMRAQEEAATNQRVALEEATLALEAEKDQASEELRMVLAELPRIRGALRAAPPEMVAQAVAQSQPDEQRFPAVCRRMTAVSEALTASRLRSDLLAQLCTALYDDLQLQLEGSPEAADRAAQCRAARIAVDGLLEQLRSLPQHAAPPSLACEDAAAEATAVLRDELVSMQNALATARQRADDADARARDAAVSMQAHQLGVESAARQRTELQEECRLMQQERCAARSRYNAGCLTNSEGSSGRPGELLSRLEDDAAELAAAERVRMLLQSGAVGTSRPEIPPPASSTPVPDVDARAAGRGLGDAIEQARRQIEGILASG